MAWAEEDYEALALRLGATPGLSERRMFGARCFMLNGNMLCGAWRRGGLVRVGKANMGAAVALEGVAQAEMGRPMGGFVEVASGTLEDDEVMDPLLALAFGFVGALPAK